MRDPWIGRIVALLSGGLCGGVLPEAGRVWVLAALVMLGLRLVSWRPRDFFGRVFRPEILLLMASLLVGFGYGALADRTLPEPLTVNHVELVGILQDWNSLADREVGLFRVEEGNAEKNPGIASGSGVLQEQFAGQTYRLTVYHDKLNQTPGEWKRVQPGDRIRFQANLARPKPVGTPGAFDLRLYLAVRGLSGTISAQGDVALLTAGEPSIPWKIRQQVRSRLQAWDPEETGVLEGIFFGDSSRIPDWVQEQYKATGVLHVFAASGSNVAFVLGLFWLVFGFLPKWLRISATIVVLLLYASLCGGNAPIVRATILGIALLMGKLGRGKVATLRWLFFAAAGLFVQNPLIIQDLGFQLSFAAAWGIMVLTPRLLEATFFKRMPTLFRFVVAGTIAAQVATLPLLMAAFHRLSLIGFLVNIFILFIIGGVLEVGLVGVILSFSTVLSAPFFQASLWLLKGTNELLSMLAQLPYADVWVLNPGSLFWLLWYGGLGAILWGRKRLLFMVKGRVLYLGRGLKDSTIILLERYCPSVICRVRRQLLRTRSCRALSGRRLPVRFGGVLLIFLVLWSPWNSENVLEVDMIDVGQGDSILIRTPANHALLIDTGPRSERFDAGERLVIPYLLQTGIGHLDALLITHEHQDHIGGVRAVLANIPTDWVGVPEVGDRMDNEEWKAGLPVELNRQSELLRTLQAGDRIDLDSGAWLDVVGPHQVLKETHSDPNNNSLVLKLNYLGHSVWLTGDMEQEEMQDILETGVDVETDIFKEPHHGSRFSLYKPWLDVIHPAAVLISVGKNTFGHPSPEALQYWQERHIPVYRTDEHGTVRFLLAERGAEVIPGR